MAVVAQSRQLLSGRLGHNRHGVAIVPEALHRSKAPAEAGVPALRDVAELNSMTGRKKIGGFTGRAAF
jgi:hypothetical protein